MQINLHLGIHKTATTYQQDQLNLCKDYLHTRHNVQYISLSTMRKGITQTIRNKSSHEIRTVLTPYINTDKLIISDENISGNAQEIITGRIYNNTSQVIKKIKEAFPNAKINVFVSVRNACDYLASIYCEYLRHNKFITFKEYTKNISPEYFDWNKLLKRSIEENKNINFYILNFDNYKNNKNRHINLLSFGIIKNFSPEIKASRKTLTNECISIISKFPYMSSKILNTMEQEEYVYGQKFSPFKEQERERHIENFESILQSLSIEKNVRLI